MKVTCYGSRGSLPTPSRKNFSTVEFGGNTNCFYIEAGPHKSILDCGSGVAVLGDHLMKEWLAGHQKPMSFIVGLSHYHWDHIQGLPFCVPFFIGNTFDIHGFRPSGHENQNMPRTAVETMLAHQQSNPHFPIAHESLPSSRRYISHDRQFSEVIYYNWDEHVGSVMDNASFKLGDPSLLRITTIPLNHPNGAIGYRLDYGGHSVAYCCDSEPFRYPNARITSICKDVDLLIMDGAYTEEQLTGNMQTFGHGSPESCVDQALECGAKHLLITHHEPKHDDKKLRHMQAEARLYASKKERKIDLGVAFAREGEEILVGSN